MTQSARENGIKVSFVQYRVSKFIEIKIGGLYNIKRNKECGGYIP
jgi:hypothetical protein